MAISQQLRDGKWGLGGIGILGDGLGIIGGFEEPRYTVSVFITLSY